MAVSVQVKCRLCPRDSGGDESLVAWIKLGSMFTHHQKSVILDSQVEGESQRRLIAFMGGIDLCDGRSGACHESSLHRRGLQPKPCHFCTSCR